MPDVFISYSAKDEQLAQFVRGHLAAQQLDVFLASISLTLGQRWAPQIFEALRAADWVFLLASKNALASANAQVSQLAARVKADKIKRQLVAGAVFAGLLFIMAKAK